MTASEYAITASGQSAAIEVGASNSLMLSLRGGTVNATGIVLAFEGSMDSANGADGTWFAISAGRVGANTVDAGWGTGTPATLNANVGASTAWRVNVANLSFFRVRASGLTAGNFRVLLSANPDAIDPVPVLTPTANPSPTGVPSTTVSAATTNAAVLRNSAAEVYDITVSNPTGTAAFVKFYDKATAPNLASDVPVMTIPAPAGGFQAVSFGFLGKRFSAGVGIAITGAAPATDTTAAVAGVVVHVTRGA